MSYDKDLQKKVDSLPREKRQEVLDLMFKGLSVGEVSAHLKLDSMVVGRIIINNIVTTKTLSREAK